ncbi:MAG TPA: cystathionine beta-lyase [Candidatus Methylomirabilis sp.]|nr:cystathionine beta-lyase [Candidatus Methylomirabilis sp.]
MKFASRLVSFDVAPGDPFRPMATPIYQTATFEQEEATGFGSYDYSRSGNPTRTVLEEQIAALENGTRGFCFSSGMAAITCITRLLRSGDEIVAESDLYGGACRLFTRVLERTGITARYADAGDLEAFAGLFSSRTKLVYLESPTNPLLRVVDIRQIADLAHASGALLAVDSSTMSPYLQNPLDLGADIVLHSATKYLCGHSDVTAGAVVVKDDELAKQIYFLQNAEGNAIGPFDAFLFLRGLKTLKLRLDCQQKNAQAIAEWLEAHPQVTGVNYPGLASSPGYLLQRKQARGAGAVLSFTTGSVEVSRRIVEATSMFSICVSFGSINSTISLPGCMSHASVPPEVGKVRELPADLVRISVGIEDAGDLIADLEQAFAATAIAPEEVAEEDASEVA